MGTSNNQSKSYECCIIGAGPAGLGAALELTKHNVTNILIVDKNSSVGGLSRTEVHDGIRFDMGPHRFFTKNKEVDRLWHEILGADFRPVSRFTTIFYKNKYFNYPVKPIDILKLGPMESMRIALSFVAAQIEKKSRPLNFEDWIVKKFGRRLYEIFFKTYTEKVWGIPCNRIGVEWAAQRIKNLDATEVIKKILNDTKDTKIKTLVRQFNYPILGAGQMYEALCDKVVASGASLMLNTKVTRVNRRNEHIESIDAVDRLGNNFTVKAHHFFSCIPLSHLFNMFNPSVEGFDARFVADTIRYRDHITVNVLIDRKNPFPYQWIYIHSSSFQMARVANYNNFSSAMVGGKDKTALSVEYFVSKTECLWNESDESIGDLAITELSAMGLIDKKRARVVAVTRETEAYPSHYVGFEKPYKSIRDRLEKFTNLYCIGRGGMHKYNNQDHSILSGILAARNYLRLPGFPYALWDINTDNEYQE